jgi:hypothetical protein
MSPILQPTALPRSDRPDKAAASQVLTARSWADWWSRFSLPAALLACMMVVLPLLNTVLRLWPLQPGNAAWRHTAEDLLSMALLSCMVGYVLLNFIAGVGAPRFTLVVLAIVNALGAGALLFMAGEFAINVGRLHGAAAPVARPVVLAGGVKASFKLLAFAVVLGFLASSAFRAWRTRGASVDDDASARLFSAKPSPGQ